MNSSRSPAGRGAARQEGRRRVRLQREGRTRRGGGEMGGGREKRTRFRHRRPRYVRGPVRSLAPSTANVVIRGCCRPHGSDWVLAAFPGWIEGVEQCRVFTWCLPRLKTHLCNNQRVRVTLHTHALITRDYLKNNNKKKKLNVSSCESDSDSSQRWVVLEPECFSIDASTNGGYHFLLICFLSSTKEQNSFFLVALGL